MAKMEVVDDTYQIVTNGTDIDKVSPDEAWEWLALSVGVGDDPMTEAKLLNFLLSEEVAVRTKKDNSIRMGSVVERDKDLIGVNWEDGFSSWVTKEEVTITKRWTQTQVAEKVNKRQPFVAKRLSLLKLIDELQEKIPEGMVANAGYILARITDSSWQARLADQEKITIKDAETLYKMWESDATQPEKFDLPDFDGEYVDPAELDFSDVLKPGLFLNPEEVAALVEGKEVTINYEGETFDVRRVAHGKA